MHTSGGFAIIHGHHLLVLQLHLYLTMKDHSSVGASEILFMYPALVVWSLEGSSEPLWKRLLSTLLRSVLAHNLGQSGQKELDILELVQRCQPPPTSESCHVPALVVSSA
jgi:hypothetical protein